MVALACPRRSETTLTGSRLLSASRMISSPNSRADLREVVGVSQLSLQAAWAHRCVARPPVGRHVTDRWRRTGEVPENLHGDGRPARPRGPLLALHRDDAGSGLTVLDRQRWTTREDLRLAIITWIEKTYHRRRRQRRLGRLTPIEFETPAQTAHAA
jgi:putative transposase